MSTQSQQLKLFLVLDKVQKVAKNLDIPRLRAALEATEKKGPLESQDKVWIETARRYNSGEGLPKKYASSRPERAITKAIVYQTIYKKLKLTIKTPKKKSGRPNLGQPSLENVLAYLQNEAIKKHWSADNPGWPNLNSLRESLGLPTVAPVDRPTLDHFREPAHA